MTVARTVADILTEHTTLEMECIDRMYLNLYVPILQREAGIAHFWQAHRGHRFASGTQMGPMSRAFVASIDRFAPRAGRRVRSRSANEQSRRQRCDGNLARGVGSASVDHRFARLHQSGPGQRRSPALQGSATERDLVLSSVSAQWLGTQPLGATEAT